MSQKLHFHEHMNPDMNHDDKPDKHQLNLKKHLRFSSTLCISIRFKFSALFVFYFVHTPCLISHQFIVVNLFFVYFFLLLLFFVVIQLKIFFTFIFVRFRLKMFRSQHKKLYWVFCLRTLILL